MFDNYQSEFALKKAEGNTLFKLQNFSSAISVYSSAIEILKMCGGQQDDLGVVYRNRALCQLRLHRYQQCIEDSTSSLKIIPSDVKALYRRAVALKHLGFFKQALDDVRRILQIEPLNPEAISLGESLNLDNIIQDKGVSTAQGLIFKVFSILSDNSVEEEEKERASKNLVLLVDDSDGAQNLLNSDKLISIIHLLPTLHKSCQKHILYSLSALCRFSVAATLTVFDDAGYLLVNHYLHDQNVQVQNASASIILHSMTSLLFTEEGEMVSEEFLHRAEEVANQVIICLSTPSVSFNTRESLLDCLLPAVSCPTMQDFLMKNELVKTILIVCSFSYSSPELRTSKIRGSIISVLHNFVKVVKANADHYKSIQETCYWFVLYRMKEDDPNYCLEGLTVLSHIAQAIPEIGNEILGNEKILSVALSLCKSSDERAQLIVAENIAIAASAQDRYHNLIDCLPLLRTLYQGTNPRIQVRALVGICKLTTLSKYHLANDSCSDNFVMACCEFITNDSDEIQRWAMEGLAYLSISAPIKELICGNEKLLHSVLDLIGINTDTSVQYGAVTLFVNITNSYDQQQRNPELEQLARFSGEIVQTPHVLDGIEYLTGRVTLLLKLNIVPALNQLSNSPSLAIREQISRIYLALVEPQNNRGCVVQQGGGKSLIFLAKSNSRVGREKATQAIAKILITTNPQLAFPGERLLETISSLIILLKSEQQLLQFEALMALTNISSLGPKYCKKIVYEKGIHWIESLQFEENQMLRRAATECMCNLVLCEEVKELFRQEENDRIKLLILFSGEGDYGLRKAATGALCILSVDHKICRRILDVKQYFEITEELLGSNDNELQFRGIYILTNIIFSGLENAQIVLHYARGLELLELCTTENFSERVRGLANAGLEQLISYGIVKASNLIQS